MSSISERHLEMLNSVDISIAKQMFDNDEVELYYQIREQLVQLVKILTVPPPLHTLQFIYYDQQRGN